MFSVETVVLSFSFLNVSRWKTFKNDLCLDRNARRWKCCSTPCQITSCQCHSVRVPVLHFQNVMFHLFTIETGVLRKHSILELVFSTSNQMVHYEQATSGKRLGSNTPGKTPCAGQGSSTNHLPLMQKLLHDSSSNRWVFLLLKHFQK